MKYPIIFSFISLLLLPFGGMAQIITTDPALPFTGDSVIIYYDATQGTAGLEDYTGDVYAHTGVLTKESSGSGDWKYVKTDWCENTPETKLTRISANLYSLEISPSIRDYYGVPEEEEITHMTFVFRNSDRSLEGKKTDGSDILVADRGTGFYSQIAGDASGAASEWIPANLSLSTEGAGDGMPHLEIAIK